MAQAGLINSFGGGLDQDTSVNKYNRETYFDALDLRVVSNEALSNGALCNFHGNKAVFDLLGTNRPVVQYCTIRDTLILFSYKKANIYVEFSGNILQNEIISITVNGVQYKFLVTTAPYVVNATYLDNIAPGNGCDNITAVLNKHIEFTSLFDITTANDFIYFNLKENTVYSPILFSTTGVNEYYVVSVAPISYIHKVENYNNITELTSATELYNDSSSQTKLNFYYPDHISAVGRYETTSIRKIYWANGVDELRFLNIDDPDLSSKSVIDMDITREFTLPTFSTSIIDYSRGYDNGIVQYAVQYYTKNGSESVYSTLSHPIRLSRTVDNLSDSKNAIALTIGGLDDRFTHVKIISVYYKDYTSLPSINIINDSAYSDSSLSIIDYNISYGVVTAEEYKLLNKTSYVPKLIESKNNILFQGNIDEKTFESEIIDNWDSRAYPFSSSLGTFTSVLYGDEGLINGDDVNDEKYILTDFEGEKSWQKKVANVVVDSGEGWIIPSDWACVNRENNIYSNAGIIPNQIYNTTGVDGGEGLNIRYSFAWLDNDSDFGSGIEFIKCMPGEIFRVGIEFFDSKGKSSYIKWVGDIRFPDFPGPVASELSVYLKLEILNPPNDPNIKSWRVVRAVKSASDRTIVANGVLGGCVGYSWTSEPSDDFHIPAMTLSKTIGIYVGYKPLYPIYGSALAPLVFHSPDTIFNNTKSSLSAAKLRIYGQGYRQNDAVVQTSYISSTIGVSEPLVTPIVLNINAATNVKPQYLSDNDDNKIMEMSAYRVGNYNFKNVKFVAGSGSYPTYEIFAVAGGCSALVLDCDQFPGTDFIDYTPYAVILNNVDLSRYGGSSIKAKSSNIYIPFSITSTNLTGELSCYAGDSYRSNTTYYKFVNSLYIESTDINESINEVISVPIHSYIDVSRRSDNINDYEQSKLHETVQDCILYNPKFDQTIVGDLYKINSVFSRELTLDSGIPKPVDFTPINYNEVRVLASNPKLNGESVDSWSHFLNNNFIEVDTQYGSLNYMKLFKNNLMFFQSDSIGILSVNDRSMIQDGSVGQLALGTGGVLSRYDYICTFSGAEYPKDVITSNDAVYYIDSKANLIYNATDTSVSLSEMSGLNSLLKKLIPQGNRLCGFDNEFKEVLFTINGTTLCFNERIKSFTSRYSCVPYMYISTTNGLYSYKYDNSVSYIYKHNLGAIGEWYSDIDGNDKSTSFVKIIVSPGQNKIHAFDTLDLRTEVFADGQNAPDCKDLVYNGVSRIKYSNSYINEIAVETKDTTSISAKMKRLARQWRTQVPLTKNSNRFVDTHIMITLEFDNESNKLFKLHDIITRYRTYNG